MDKEIKIGDIVTPISPSLCLADVPTDGNHYQLRNDVCLFKGKGKVLAIHKVVIDYNEWAKEDELGEHFIKCGPREYKDYFIKCEAGIGWGSRVVKVEEPKSFYDKLWELISTKVGDNPNADELTDRVMDLIEESNSFTNNNSEVKTEDKIEKLIEEINKLSTDIQKISSDIENITTKIKIYQFEPEMMV